MESHKKICILGSANQDYFLIMNKIPAVGQTIQANHYFLANGGKGANQAVSVGKLAGKSIFLGQVGNDEARGLLEKQMIAANVQLKWKILQNGHTGKAYILVDEKGENSIVIYGGANMAFGQELDESFQKAIQQSDYLLLQKQIPMNINLIAAKFAYSKGKTVILDCGGRDDPIPAELLDNITYISPNQTELKRIDQNIQISQETFDFQKISKSVREVLLSKHPKLRILLKLGKRGAAIITNQVLVKGPSATRVNKAVLDDYKIIDTVGAGDCFTGAFAVKHSQINWQKPQDWQNNYKKCMAFGNSAAFLCITKKGAMPSMPLRDQVQSFIAKYQIV